MQEADAPDDQLEAALRRIRERIAARTRNGTYPIGLDDELDGHFDRLAAMGRLDDVDAAATTVDRLRSAPRLAVDRIPTGCTRARRSCASPKHPDRRGSSAGRGVGPGRALPPGRDRRARSHSSAGGANGADLGRRDCFPAVRTRGSRQPRRSGARQPEGLGGPSGRTRSGPGGPSYMMQIHQVLVTAAPGDAITRMAFHVRDLLGPARSTARSMPCRFTGPVHGGATTPRLPTSGPERVMIYRSSIGHREVTRLLQR